MSFSQWKQKKFLHRIFYTVAPVFFALQLQQIAFSNDSFKVMCKYQITSPLIHTCEQDIQAKTLPSLPAGTTLLPGSIIVLCDKDSTPCPPNKMLATPEIQAACEKKVHDVKEDLPSEAQTGMAGRPFKLTAVPSHCYVVNVNTPSVGTRPAGAPPPPPKGMPPPPPKGMPPPPPPHGTSTSLRSSAARLPRTENAAAAHINNALAEKAKGNGFAAEGNNFYYYAPVSSSKTDFKITEISGDRALRIWSFIKWELRTSSTIKSPEELSGYEKAGLELYKKAKEAGKTDFVYTIRE